MTAAHVSETTRPVLVELLVNPFCMAHEGWEFSPESRICYLQLDK